MPKDLNAWHLVALGAGATLVHAYHTIVNAGGVKPSGTTSGTARARPRRRLCLPPSTPSRRHNDINLCDLCDSVAKN